MNKRLLRWITILLPIGFLGFVFLTLNLVIGEIVELPKQLLIFAVATIAVLFFSNWVFSIIDHREVQINKYAAQLETLNKASIVITTELEMAILLQNVVDIGRDLVPSQYGALGILNDSGMYYEQFIPSGIEDSQVNAWEMLGEGVLNSIGVVDESFRENNLGGVPQTHEFHQKYPNMESALGVPLILKSKIIGILFLVNKISKSNEKDILFTEEDQQILEMFAKLTAIVIENVRLYRKTRRLAVLQERERFGMDLHDGVIQSIYAVGLMLEDIRGRVKTEPEEAHQGLSTAIVSLNNAISDLRNYILNLRPHHFQGRNLIEGVEELARALRANTFMNVYVEMEGLDASFLSSSDTSELLHITQEALSNVQKHARASDTEIRARVDGQVLNFWILDNGISIPAEMILNSNGNGLNNMRERTEILNGTIEIKSIESGGTEIHLEIPLKNTEKPIS